MADRFDELTRILGSGISRREAIRRVAGGFAGSYMARILAATGFVALAGPGRETAPLLATAPFDKVQAGMRPANCSEANCPPGDIPPGRVCAIPANSCCPDKTSVCLGTDVCCPTDLQCCPGDPKHVDVRCCPQKFECCGIPARCCDTAKKEECCKDPLTGALICCDTINNCCCTGTCNPRPGIDLEAYHREPVSQIEMGVEDYAGQGLKSISVVINVNAKVDIPNLPPGTPYARVVATRVDPAKPARVVLRVCTECCGCSDGDCCKDGDPVLTTLQIPTGRRQAWDTFAALSASERYLTVQNGAPGLRRVRVTVNGLVAGSLRLHHGETGRLDLHSFMIPEKNIITLTGEGDPGSAALVLLSDVPGTKRRPDAVPTKAQPQIPWQAGPWQAGQNLHWGR